MNICFLVRLDFFSKFGGDTQQILTYKNHWEKLGDKVTIVTDGNYINEYDIYIVVNIDRFLETFKFLREIEKANLLTKTFILPIHHNYEHIVNFEINSRKGLMGLLTKKLGFFGREKLKSLYWGVNKNREYFFEAIRQLFVSHKTLISKYNNNLTFIFIASGEKLSLEKDFEINIKNFLFTRNGCDFNNLCVYDRNIDVLVSGRIESRKNSLAIANALKRTNASKVVFVGGFNKNNKKYISDFNSLISSSDNLEYIGKVDHDNMISLYQKSKIHISASWFEVSSLVDLESYYNGCHVVSSINGNSKEYLNDNATYIDPGCCSSLTKFVNQLMEVGINDVEVLTRRKMIEQNHSWEVNSKKLLNDIKVLKYNS